MSNLNYSKILSVIAFTSLATLVAILGVAPAFGQVESDITITQGAGASASVDCVAANNCFSPNPITVTPGTTVTWTNTDTMSHTVTSGKVSDDNSGSLFDSGFISGTTKIADHTFQFTFATAGTYDYFCTVHPWMVGQVIVGSGSNVVTPPPVVHPPTVSIKTDLPSYNQGDTIVMTGHVSDVTSGSAILLRIFNSGGQLISLAQLVPASDGSFTKSFLATGPLWTNAGTYTIEAQYGKYGQPVTTTFYYNGGTGSTLLTQAINATYPLQSGSQIYNVPYIIKGATVKSMDIFAFRYTLEITLSPATSDGSITVTLPRSMIDARIPSVDPNAKLNELQDNKFIVAVSGIAVSQFSESKNQNVRILSIPFHAGDTKVDIVGTVVNAVGNTPPSSTGVITVTTEKPSYNDGDKITISGSTQEYISGTTPITVIIISPMGETIKVDQVDLGADKTYSTSITATGTLWQAAGTYHVVAKYGSMDRTVQTTFQFTGSAGGQQGPSNSPSTPNNMVTTSSSSSSINLSQETGDSQEAQMSVSGNNVYVTWVAGSQDNQNVFFKKSTDNGATFGNTINLSNMQGMTSNPKIFAMDNNIYVTWHERSSNNYGRLLVKSIDNGATFGNTINLSDKIGQGNSTASVYEGVAISGNNIYVSWTNGTAGYRNTSIFLSRSLDDGNTFSQIVVGKLRNTIQGIPQIMTSENNVFVMWSDGSSVMFARSTDNGATFSTPMSVMGDISVYDSPQMSVSGNNVMISNNRMFSRSTDNGATFASITLNNDIVKHVGPEVQTLASDIGDQIFASGNNLYDLWILTDSKNQNSSLLFKQSTDNGNSFKNSITLSTSGKYQNPQMVVSGNDLYVFWMDYSSGSRGIFLKTSTDGGNTFSSSINLSPANSYIAQIAISGNNVYVIWVYGSESHSLLFQNISHISEQPSITPTPNTTINTQPSSPASVFTPSQQDIQNINQAKASQTIAAEVNVGANQSQTTSIDNNVSVHTNNSTSNEINISVSAPDQTGPKVIMFNLSATTINVQNLKDLGIMYDGKPIPPAPNMDAILHAKPTDSPSFAIVVTQSGVQVLVLVPHFSTHSITITNMSKVIPTVPEFPFATLALIIATFSIVLIPKIKYY